GNDEMTSTKRSSDLPPASSHTDTSNAFVRTSKRYGRTVEIGKVPGGKAGVTALAEVFGQDG
ncbi:hypothetical protein ACIQ9Q_38760, partial [Streptomyces sp. NPDC094438]|uniref:hypothetical protein n=1 Tax=Streptomyces sp. NPDC094438 TaxID=3366061 RepID=UPI003817705A